MTLKSSLVIYFYWIGLFCWSQTFTEAFNDIGDLNDWYFLNNSETPNLNWEQGNTLNMNAFSGDPNAFIGVGYESLNAAEPATISNWAVSPSRTFNNGKILLEGVSIHEIAHIRGLNHLNYGMYLLQLSYNEKIITLPIIIH
jgi:hypothetical protein